MSRKKKFMGRYSNTDLQAARYGITIDRKEVRTSKVNHTFSMRWLFIDTKGIVLEWWPETGKAWSSRSGFSGKASNGMEALNIAREFAAPIGVTNHA